MAAADVGVIVRLEPGDKPIGAAPEVRLVPVSGEAPLLVELNDDGVSPDALADDGRWAGVAMTSLNAFQITVTVGGEVLDGGMVSLPEDKPVQDLVLNLEGQGLTVETSGAEQPSGAAGQQLGAQAGASSSPAPDGRQPAGPSSPGAAPASPRSVTSGEIPWAWGVLGISVLALSGLFLLRGGEGGGDYVAVDLECAPEPPIFGTGSPAVHTGVSLWHVQWPDRAVFLHGLVASLAQHHRVLVVGARSTLAPMAGGPVFSSSETNFRLLRSTLDRLLAEPGMRLVVVVVDPDPSLARVRAVEALLTEDVGGLIVTAQPPDGADEPYVVDVHEGGATLTRSGHTLPLASTRLGYVPRA